MILPLVSSGPPHLMLFFFANHTAATEIYTLSLHDALPIYRTRWVPAVHVPDEIVRTRWPCTVNTDRKSTRLNSSHLGSSYAVFCLKKKKNHETDIDLEIDATTRAPHVQLGRTYTHLTTIAS